MELGIDSAHSELTRIGSSPDLSTTTSTINTQPSDADSEDNSEPEKLTARDRFMLMPGTPAWKARQKRNFEEVSIAESVRKREEQKAKTGITTRNQRPFTFEQKVRRSTTKTTSKRGKIVLRDEIGRPMVQFFSTPARISKAYLNKKQRRILGENADSNRALENRDDSRVSVDVPHAIRSVRAPLYPNPSDFGNMKHITPKN